MKGWTVVTPLFFVYNPRRCKNWVFYRKLGGRPALSKTSQAFLKENHCESQIEINSQAGSSLKGTLSDKIFRRMENSFHFNKKNFKFSWSQIRYLLKYNHSNEIDTVFLFLYWISSTPTSALLLVTDSTNYCEMSSPVAKRFTVLNNLLCDLSYFNFALIGQFDVSFLANSIFRILHD